MQHCGPKQVLLDIFFLPKLSTDANGNEGQGQRVPKEEIVCRFFIETEKVY